jgi:hypothetical protein
MQKITNILLTLAFTSGCLSLFYLLALFQSIYPLKLLHMGLPYLTDFLLKNKFILLIIPTPFLLISAFFTFKKNPTIEINLLYIAILAVIFSFLFFLVLNAVLVPWIPINE